MIEPTIIFKRIRAKNFLSIGNAWLEIDLGSHARNLIQGENGKGKSTLLDCIIYALFGKAFRKINIGLLVNSINKKDLVVEVEFSVYGVDYKVIRGQKPGVFEIYKSGELVTQAADSRDYQAYLEKQVLKMNIRAFKQMVVIGSSDYVPFMQMKPAERRFITEDILETSIFTAMGEISRKTERSLKSDLQLIDVDIKHKKESLKSQKSLLEKLEIDRDEFLQKQTTIRTSLQSKVKILDSQISELEAEISNINFDSKRFQELQGAIKSAISKSGNIEGQISNVRSDIEDVKSKDVCHACGQDITEDMKLLKINDLDAKYETLINTYEQIQSFLKNFNDEVSELSENDVKLKSSLSNKKSLAVERSSLVDQLASLDRVSAKFNGIEDTRKSIEDLVSTLANLVDKKNLISDDLMYYNLVSAMLSDKGIKSTIVENYLPVINSLVNQYLDTFGMFVKFELDSTFEEHIKSRGRDTFTYYSFSEGEKMKIDLAILFTWRHIATMKATMSCNLLFLDEIGGGNLDRESHSSMISMVSNIAQNVFMITHREVDLDSFDRVLTFTKPKNFTVVAEDLN